MSMNVESSVRERYSEGARERQEALCCPVNYDSGLLAMLPDEIIEKDYGCGDPSRYVQKGDVVLDLGSGGGKICYMAAQLVGKGGQVIGIDMNDDMINGVNGYRLTGKPMNSSPVMHTTAALSVFLPKQNLLAVVKACSK